MSMTPAELEAHLTAQRERRRQWLRENAARLAGNPTRRAALQAQQQPKIDQKQRGTHGYIEDHRFDDLDDERPDPRR